MQLAQVNGMAEVDGQMDVDADHVGRHERLACSFRNLQHHQPHGGASSRKAGHSGHVSALSTENAPRRAERFEDADGSGSAMRAATVVAAKDGGEVRGGKVSVGRKTHHDVVHH